ncbi:CoA transferase [Pseudochelatococcus sp. B33]
MDTQLPLSGIRVVEHASGVAAAYAGRLLAAMGAEVTMIEPPGLSPLRREPPFLSPEPAVSAFFVYHSAGKRSVVCDLATGKGRVAFDRLVEGAHILIDDTPVAEREAFGLTPGRIAGIHPHVVHLSVLPFGATGPKAGWLGAELNLIHASGEGFLLPNGLSADLFPDRPPLKIAGHFAQMQGGIAAALASLAALWAGKGQYVDVAVQDAAVAVGAFTVQRYGDGSLEHRVSRSFRYGGVIACLDGHVELLTLEERQWEGLVELMGHPAWAQDAAFSDPAERSARGDFLNRQIRAWAHQQPVDDLVSRAQELGVPMARFNSPAQVLAGHHENARELFSDVDIPGAGACRIQTAPFRFGDKPLPVRSLPEEPDADRPASQHRRHHDVGQDQRDSA